MNSVAFSVAGDCAGGGRGSSSCVVSAQQEAGLVGWLVGWGEERKEVESKLGIYSLIGKIQTITKNGSA